MAVLALEFAWFLLIGPTDGHADYDSHCNADCYLPWWDSAAVWTAIFTAVLTGSTILLWVSTRQSARIAERALTEHERPWIFRDIVHVRWRVSGYALRLAPHFAAAMSHNSDAYNYYT